MPSIVVKTTERQQKALNRSGTADGWYWPRGHDILVLRALARRGLLVEERGTCGGCTSHACGTQVPVFRDIASQN